MRIDFHPAATEELASSAAWYESRSPATAQRFALAVDEAIEKIAANPARFVQIDARHRSCSVKDFPFQIVFRSSGDRVYIVAIAHAKRRPNFWQDRK